MYIDQPFYFFAIKDYYQYFIWKYSQALVLSGNAIEFGYGHGLLCRSLYRGCGYKDIRKEENKQGDNLQYHVTF